MTSAKGFEAFKAFAIAVKAMHGESEEVFAIEVEKLFEESVCGRPNESGKDIVDALAAVGSVMQQAHMLRSGDASLELFGEDINVGAASCAAVWLGPVQ